jgi:ABC-type transport system involved in multi-copper enzyme maturation permease subunit
MTFLPIVQRELLEASRRRNTYWSRVGVAAAGLLIGTWVLAFPEFRAPSRIGMALFVPLAVIAFLYCGLIGVFRTADCLSEEKREGTLGLLFLTDLRGYDIVLGKLVATSLNAAYGLLALFPVLAIPLLAGGVTLAEFIRVALVAVNTLFFSLAIGMFCSAILRDERRAMAAAFILTAFFVLGLPILCLIVDETPGWKDSALSLSLALPSPSFSAFYAFDQIRGATPQAQHFTTSVLVIHGLAWLFLVAGSLIVPRTWQDRALSAKAQRRRQRWQELGAPPVGRRKTLRQRLLGINPILWLVTRGRFKLAAVWLLLGLGGLVWTAGLLTDPRDWNNEFAFWTTSILAHTILKFWVVTESCRRFSLDRQSGALELLLSTPLPAREMVRGQVLGIERQFAGPVLVVLLADLVFVVAGRQHFAWIAFWSVWMLVFIADIFTLTWLGMWRGLNSRRPNRAALAALVRVLLVPWILIGLLLTAVGLSGAGRMFNSSFWEEYGFPLVYLVVSLSVNLLFAVPARDGLLSQFRLIATQRFEVRTK